MNTVTNTVRSSWRLTRRRGVAAVLSMLFLAIATVLVVGIYSTTTLSSQASRTYSDAMRAQAAAEGGLQWFEWRLKQVNRPRTTAGNITSSVADALWPAIRSAIAADFAAMTTPAERPVVQTATSLTSSRIAIDGTDARFTLAVRQHPTDKRFLQVTSTATAGGTRRSVSCDFRIDKKIRFAVAGRVPIQIGRNTVIEGALGMATAGKTPPFLMLSDFAHLDSTLTGRITALQSFIERNLDGYDNRIPIGSDAGDAALAANFADTNDDGFIDEYDLFLKHFDRNGDKAVSADEFTNASTGKLYDDNLFKAIDALDAPAFDGDVARAGYLDGLIDNRDGYAKVRGGIAMAITQSSWSGELAAQGKTIHDLMPGPIEVDGKGVAPVKFGATTNDIFDLSPANFDACAAGFRARSGINGGTTRRVTGRVENATLAVTDANAGTVTERTPFGSTTYQATYRRPVFRNMTLKNVIIPKGMNALFDNCTFEGVTFVDTERDIVKSTGSVTSDSSEGMNWSQRRVSGDTFSKDKVLLASGSPSSGQAITHGSQKGNNVRFNNCTFKGPIAGNYATAYTHFANSWEFTGSTLFDNEFDQTATIVSPQVNIEMGSFTDPVRAPSTLVGVVVVGNIDIRGTSVVDGSIIVTGDGAGNTTLGYFGASDADTNPVAMPEGGYGRLNIRYNPHRALPDGISLPVEMLAVPGTYREVE